MYKSKLLVLLAIAALPATCPAASIYRCAAAGGGTVFSQTPCGTDAKEVGATGAAKTGGSPHLDAINDKATLAQIDTRCEAESRKTLDDYNTRFAEANAELASLHKKLMVPGKTSAGADKDPAVESRIATVEAHKTDLLGSQDRELSTIRRQCQLDRDTELRRQADRDASRAMAKR